MADAKKKSYPKLTSPRGLAVFPKLVTPDEYKGKKQYKTGLRLEGEAAMKLRSELASAASAAMTEFQEKMQAEVAEAKGAKKVAAQKKLDAMKLHVPFKPDVDDDGNETGSVVFNFKMNASFKDQKTGEEKPLKPKLFDAKGEEIKRKLDVWGGSEIKVSYSVVPFYADASGDCGVTLKLRAVQIIKLRSGGGNASDHGFGVEEDGFDSSGLSDDTAEEAASTSASNEDEQF